MRLMMAGSVRAGGGIGSSSSASTRTRIASASERITVWLERRMSVSARSR